MLVASNGSGECGFFDEFCLGITLCATWLLGYDKYCILLTIVLYLKPYKFM